MLTITDKLTETAKKIRDLKETLSSSPKDTSKEEKPTSSETEDKNNNIQNKTEDEEKDEEEEGEDTGTITPEVPNVLSANPSTSSEPLFGMSSDLPEATPPAAAVVPAAPAAATATMPVGTQLNQPPQPPQPPNTFPALNPLQPQPLPQTGLQSSNPMFNDSELGGGKKNNRKTRSADNAPKKKRRTRRNKKAMVGGGGVGVGVPNEVSSPIPVRT